LISFIISGSSELARATNIKNLRRQLPGATLFEAIYPSLTRVPFLPALIEASKIKTGKSLLPAEIGCLLSHRKVWQQIIQMDIADNQHCLILESDSTINNLSLLNDFFDTHYPSSSQSIPKLKSPLNNYDLFFFGAWLGHMKLLRSKKQKLNDQFAIGEPFIKSVYCTYGYSVNKKAAAYLLQQTKKIGYPVDQFKKFIYPGAIRIGGIQPELINAGNMGSYINQINLNEWHYKLLMRVLDFKNNIICFFK
jgi:GR25 family glycosyltransferase involved in LPS biosynthesis